MDWSCRGNLRNSGLLGIGGGRGRVVPHDERALQTHPHRCSARPAGAPWHAISMGIVMRKLSTISPGEPPGAELSH